MTPADSGPNVILGLRANWPQFSLLVLINAFVGGMVGLERTVVPLNGSEDLVGPRSRGLAVGLNEFAGYLAVGVTAFLTGYIAAHYGLRPAPFYIGIGYAALGLTLSILLVRDTREHVRLEAGDKQQPSEVASFWRIFSLTSFGDRNLFAACQASLVNNLNDGMSWGLFPLFFVSFGLGIERVGIVKAVYPATWGVLQVATGPLSDRWGRKGLIVGGMWVQAAGLFLTALTRSFQWWLLASLLLGLGTAMVYPSLIAAVSDASHQRGALAR
jgi:MFS family permease